MPGLVRPGAASRSSVKPPVWRRAAAPRPRAPAGPGGGLSRHEVRRDAERRFTVDRMIDGYLEVYRDVLAAELQCEPSDALAKLVGATS